MANGSEFRVGQNVDGITTEGDVKLRVVGMHDGSPIVQVREAFIRGDVEHQQGEVFVADPINLIRSRPEDEGWGEWELRKSGSLLTGFEITNPVTDERLEVTFYKGVDDRKPVVQVDGGGDFRVNVNDGVVFDRHTDSADPLHDAALSFYHSELNKVEYSRHYSVEDMHKVRTALIEAGYSVAEVDSCGTLEALHCATCDTAGALVDGLCEGCREQEAGAPAAE
jgi:hypothetical protein